MQIYQVHKRERRHRQIRQVHKRENIYVLCFLQIPHWMVVPTPLKNMSSSVGVINYSQYIYIYIYIWKNKKCSKPPTSIQHEEMQPVQLLKELPRSLPHLGSQWPGAVASSHESWPMESELINDLMIIDHHQ